MTEPKNGLIIDKEHIQIHEQQQEYQGHNAIHDSVTDKNDRRTKKKKKLKPKHPPEYYQQLRRQKQIKKRELQWNNRFNIGSIPDLLDKDRGFKKAKTKTKLKSLKRAQSPKQGIVVYKTFNADNQNRTKPSKSFNIRVLSKKQQKQESIITKKKSQPTNTQQKTQKQKTQKQKVKQQQQAKQSQNLIQQITKAHTNLNFPQCHKNMLIQIVKKSNQRVLKSFIHAEIAKLTSKTSSVSILVGLIEKRDKIMLELQSIKENISDEDINKYRIATLKVIQQILKWRDQWENIYHQLTKQKTRLQYKSTRSQQSYLHTIYAGPKVHQNNNIFDTKGNPFLLGYHKQDPKNELMIKIRACEMLLLEDMMQNSNN